MRNCNNGVHYQNQQHILMKRRYCLMWITHYDVEEFLHVSQLRDVVLGLRYVVLQLGHVILKLRSVVLELRSVVLELR